MSKTGDLKCHLQKIIFSELVKLADHKNININAIFVESEFYIQDPFPPITINIIPKNKQDFFQAQE